MKHSGKRILVEISLWTVANAISLIVSSGLTYLSVRYFLDWSAAKSGTALTASLLFSLTWGSWAALVWTKTKALRRLQETLTLIPGFLVIIAGGAGLYLGFGAKTFWLMTIVFGFGILAIPLMLLKQNHNKLGASKFSIPLGLFAYPLITTIASLAIWSMWYTNTFASFDVTAIPRKTALMTGVIAIALTTTIIPSLVSTSLRRASIFLEKKSLK